jgi:acetyl-CoA acetyltransferase
MPSSSRAFITGVGNTRFGKHPGRGALELMGEAATRALADADLAPSDVDGVLCGYATTLPHLMLSTLFCERFGLIPSYVHSIQAGGATGAAMVMLAGELVRSGRCTNVLVVGGENRATGQSRDTSVQMLAQVGDAEHEVPNGASIPAYYALLASRYMHETGTAPEDLALLAVLMREHAAQHPDAHLQERLTVAGVLASKTVATPLRLLDCCPISDGGAAVVMSSQPRVHAPVRLRGAGQAHLHQHLSAMRNVMDTGAARSAQRAFDEAGMALADADFLGIYDSFTVTLAMLLEEIGFAARGEAAACAAAGDFGTRGRLPLNTHGGLLSFGHSGLSGGLAHVVEAVRQLTGRAGIRQVPASNAFVHADGGVLSTHVSLLLSREN